MCLAVSSATPFGFTGAAHWLPSGPGRGTWKGHNSQFLGMHWLLYWNFPVLRLRAFGVRLLPLRGEHSTLYLKVLLSRVK